VAAASFSRCAAVAVFCCCPAAQAADVTATPSLTEEPFFGIGWLDQTQSFGTARADALAQQLDRFFGVERSDLEAAYSSLRLTTEARWHESDYIKPRVRLRGRLHLPRVDERVSLIFSEDQGEGTSYYNQNPGFVEQQSTRVNLEVNLRERERYRFDFRVGLRSSGRLRTGMRLRYEDDLGRNFFHRLSETVYYIDGTGYGSFTQYQLDRPLTVNSLLRWSTEFRAQESLAANEWASSLSYLYRRRQWQQP
jgi:opacity protein-like surface antigen